MAHNITFVRDPVSWEHEFKSWDGEVGVWMRRVTLTTAATARVEAPHPGGPAHGRTGINYSTGRLAGGITTGFEHFRGDLEGQVIALPNHSLMLHQGTRPHVIKPKKPGGRLVFFWHKVGHVVSFKKVNHPGTREDPFLVRALQKVIRTFG